MNIFQSVKEAVTTKQAAETYGIRIRKNGMACCPFHNDKTPSMKVDKNFICFGCQERGDVIRFTQLLFNLSPYEAARKLADDFGLAQETWKPGKGKKKPKPATHRLTQEQRFAETEKHFYRILTDYYHLLKRWKKEEAPEEPEGEWPEHFTEALGSLALVEYLMDTMLAGTLEEKVDLMNDYREKVAGYERRIEEASGREAGRTGENNGGIRKSCPA